MGANRIGNFARVLALSPNVATDAELVSRFAADRSPEAFAELVRRHGPMVLSVCRRMLRNAADADDAFQAAFLVLARKADVGAVRGPVANWLYGVAVRTATSICRATARRSARISWDVEMSSLLARPTDHAVDAELAARLDVELATLPDKYRAAIVLCELEGRSLKDAATALGVPTGTVASRLARGRDLLAVRMRRAVPVGAVSGLLAPLSQTASAQVPSLLFDRTAASVFDSALIPETVSHAVRQVSIELFLCRLRVVASAGLALLAITGATAFGLAADGSKPSSTSAPVAAASLHPGMLADKPKESDNQKGILFVDRVGEWHVEGISIQVRNGEHGAFHYSIKHDVAPDFEEERSIGKAKKPWFIWVEDKETVWQFDSFSLRLLTYVSGRVSHQSVSVQDDRVSLYRSPPSFVMQKLPRDLRDKIGDAKDGLHKASLALTQAVLIEDAHAVRRALRDGADPDASIPNRVYPLTCLEQAARVGNLEIINVLLDHNATSNRRVGEYSPLHVASASGQLDAIKLLLKRGANPGLETARGVMMQSVLDTAVKYKRKGVAQFWVEHGIPITESTLNIAKHSGNDLLEWLVAVRSTKSP